jgi:two-component sensor histidine kinase/ABC-type amino acid transport substrate-binding protein
MSASGRKSLVLMSLMGDYSLVTNIRLAAATAVLGLCLSLAAAEPRSPAELRVVCDDNYPPYAFIDSEGKLQGIVPDHWREWERATGVKVGLRGLPWSEALEEFAADRADVIDTIFDTPERRASYAFTPAYAKIDVPVFIHKSISGIASASDLAGFRVAVKAGDASVGELSARGVTALVPYEDYEEIIDAAARMDQRIFCVDKPPALYYLYKRGIERDFRIAFILNRGAFHRAVKKGRTELLALVEKGFSAVPPSTYSAINRKWLGSELARGADLRLIAIIVVAALSAAAFFFVSAWILRRRVRRATAELREKVGLLEASEARNRAALAEKEILLKEIHHRVKNNMQIISSLIQLKAGETRSEGDPSLISDIQVRIQSMAQLHELLYRSGDLASIDAAEYLRGIAAELSIGYGLQSVPFAGESVRIEIDTALPLGLIVGELLINSLKYAYPRGDRGPVAMSLGRRGESIVLRVEDNGVGLPPGVDPADSPSMGFTIVRGLAGQLRGELAFGGPPGFWAELVFKAPPSAQP